MMSCVLSGVRGVAVKQGKFIGPPMVNSYSYTYMVIRRFSSVRVFL